jgi:hypothetical protein
LKWLLIYRNESQSKHRRHGYQLKKAKHYL